MTTLVGGMCGICCHIALVLISLYAVLSYFNLQLFLSIVLHLFFNLVLKRQTEMVMVPASPNFICHFSQEQYRRDSLLESCVYVLCLCNVLFSIVFNLC